MDRRIQALPTVRLRSSGHELGLNIGVADSFRARLIGLAGSGVNPCPAAALWLPRTRSIHTFGMGFPLDLVWLNDDGTILRIDRSVLPRRVITCRSAASVIELAGGAAAAHSLANGLRLTA